MDSDDEDTREHLSEDEPMTDGGVSTFLRHHNYRHRPHTGHSDERISRQINLQYRHMPGHLIHLAYAQRHQRESNNSSSSSHSAYNHGGAPGSAPASTLQGPSNAHSVVSPASLLAKSPNASVTSFRPLERHIHFNDRVEQCIAVDSYDSSSDEDKDEDDDDDDDNDISGNGYQTRGRHGHRFSRDWRSSRDADSDSEGGYRNGNLHDNNDSSSSSSSDEEDEDEPGLFLSLRSSSSTTSLHRMDRLASLSSGSSPKSQHAIIAPLPATTLRVPYDNAEEEEFRRAEAASSVAYAMSHNTQPRTHIYTTYDYNSVYKSPSQSPQVQSPQPSSVSSSANSSTTSTVKAIDPAKIVGPSNLLQSNKDDDSDDDRVLSLPSHLSAQMPIASASSAFQFGREDDSDSDSDSDSEAEVIIGRAPSQMAQPQQQSSGLLRSSGAAPQNGGMLQRASTSATNLAGFMGGGGNNGSGAMRSSSSILRSSRSSSSTNLANFNNR